MKLNVKKIIYVLILSLSVLGNFAFIMSDGWFDFNVSLAKHIERQSGDEFVSIEDMMNQISLSSLDMISGNRVTPKPMPYSHSSLRSNFLFNLKGYDSNTPLFYWGGGWLMKELLEEAIGIKDESRIQELKQIFDTKVLHNEIKYVDQSLFGISALFLHKYTQDDKYLNYADNVYKFLCNQDTSTGIPYRSNLMINLVDGLGMYNPFLVYYADYVDNKEAYQLAVRQVEIFAKYAMDDNVGLCSHGYTMGYPYTKCGSSNWGRGNGWLALGLLYIDLNDLSESAKHKVNLFAETCLYYYKKDGKLTTFIGQDGNEDVSATLPILLFLHKNGYLKIDYNTLLNLSKYVHDGIIYQTSGECGGLNRYSNYSGPSPLSQAMLLNVMFAVNRSLNK